MEAWEEITTAALDDLFSGSEESIDRLTTLISDGKLVSGKSGPMPDPNEATTHGELVDSITKSLFAFAIPAIWSFSNRHPFVIDSGYSCGAEYPLEKYMSKKTMNATEG